MSEEGSATAATLGVGVVVSSCMHDEAR